MKNRIFIYAAAALMGLSVLSMTACGSNASETSTESSEAAIDLNLKVPDIEIEKDSYRGFLMAQTDSYEDYMVVFYNSKGQLTALSEECHFYASAGYTADILYHVDPDTVYEGFSDASFTSVEVEDLGEQIDYILWFEHLNDAAVFEEACRLNFFSTETENASCLDADSLCDYYLSNGAQELTAGEFEELGLHSDHIGNPYDPNAEEGSTTAVSYANAQEYFADYPDQLTAFTEGVTDEENQVSAAVTVDDNALCMNITLGDLAASDISEEALTNARTYVEEETDTMTEGLTEIKEEIGLDCEVTFTMHYITGKDNGIFLTVTYSSDGSCEIE